VLAGYSAGQSYAKVEATLGREPAPIILGIALVTLLVWRIQKHRADTSTHDSDNLTQRECSRRITPHTER
jgi:membrane-associated protein